jgi:hypothetical protein
MTVGSGFFVGVAVPVAASFRLVRQAALADAHMLRCGAVRSHP